MLKQAIPNVFVKDFEAALAYYTGPLGFHPLFVYGEIPFYAHVARDEAILAIRRVAGPVLDHTAGEDLLSAFIEVSTSTPCTTACEPTALTSARRPETSPGRCSLIAAILRAT